MPRLNLGIKLGAIVLAVVVLALGVVYVAVVPRLESRLVDAKLDELERSAAAASQVLPDAVLYDQTGLGLPAVVDLFATENAARVVVYSRTGDDSLGVYWDSARSSAGSEMVDDPVALGVLDDTSQPQRGRVRRDGSEWAQVAIPLRESGSFVLLFSANLDDQLRSISLIRNSLLVAGAIALAVAWFAGSMATFRFARRIRRLETAAERIAQGDFAQPVVDDGHDELGDLAEAFERMRLQLDQLDSARRAFIANASHELRTPLFSLGGFLELLDDEDLDEATRRDFAEQMRQQVERLTRLTTDLLDLSRMDAGQLAVQLEPVDLAACAVTLGEEFGALAESTGHVLTVASDGPVPGMADEQRVLRIGRALVENALRHTPAGTSVRITAASTDDRPRLTVTDDGPGIPPEHQERLFERFYRGDSRAAFGSGLGLAIARELAMRMNGSIGVSSRPGRTTFTLEVPLARNATAFSRENATGLSPVR